MIIAYNTDTYLIVYLCEGSEKPSSASFKREVDVVELESTMSEYKTKSNNEYGTGFYDPSTDSITFKQPSI
jgi:hypothetical protein